MVKPAVLLLVAAVCGFLAFPAAARERITTIAGLTVHEWAPTGQLYARAPVVIFSHGLHSCGDQSASIMEALAVKGFWVFAPDHADARCRSTRGSTFSPPTAESPDDGAKPNQPSRWSSATYRSRMDELVRLLDALRADPERQPDLDFTRIALAGHSLGGYTVLGMAGAWPEWKDGWNNTGIRAVLTFAPYTQPFLNAEGIAAITLPVMFQAAARDNSITSPLTREETGVYAITTAPKYLVVLKDAGHYAWTDLNSDNHDRIIRYSVAFLQNYLTGETSPMLTQGGKTLNLFAYESELGKTDPDSGKKGGLKSGGNSGGSATLRSGSWRDRESKFGSGSGGVIINDSRTRKAAESQEATPPEPQGETPQEAE